MYALLFSCFAVIRLIYFKRVIVLLFFFFYYLHLHSRLSAFLLSSDCRLATTFIFILGVGDPSILRVSYRKLAAG